MLALASILPGCPTAGHEEVLRVRRELAAWLAAGRGGAPLPPRPPRPPPRERIRVGYLSSWFPAANYMKPVYGLLNAHDRRAVEIHLFSDAPPDAPFPGYRPGPGDRVHPVAGFENDAVAEAVRLAGIDVLVDLNGASSPGRLGLFLAPCAPVVLAWFNQYATSGLPGIDGIVGDGEVVRPEEERFYSERVFRLPLSYLTFEVTHPAPPVAPPPAATGGPLRFGSLVSAYKLTDPTLDLWAEVLSAAPGSRLVLANSALGKECNRLRLADRFASRGIGADRLEMLGPAPHREFLAYNDRIDVALDAFPNNGGTTTMEAFWQGVPVLSYSGDRWAGRTTASIARRSPAAEFVRGDAKDLAAFAGALATDPATPARLAALRRTLRADLARSSACDTPSLARAMESLYRLALADPAWPGR
jgi:predicted O-linked N-acetylglucosamine transferase (SPINDLY family)